VDLVSNLKPLVFALHDSLMLIAPGGWTKVEVTVSLHDGQVVVEGLSTRGEGSKTPRPRPDLKVDLRDEAVRLGEALTDLHRALEGRWAPGRVRVERPNAEFCDWKLLRTDGSVAWFSRLERAELDSLLITDALLDALQGTEGAFHSLQAQLQQRLGPVTGFAFDPAHGVLRLDQSTGALELPAQVVGSYLPDVFTWVWSWSEEAATSASCDRVRRICQPELKPDGLAALWRPHFHCDEGFAWVLAGHVAVSLGARGLFRAVPPGADAALFFAVLQ
jgi:hypothetical protein